MSKKKKILQSKKNKPKKVAVKETQSTFDNDGLDPEVAALFAEVLRNAPPTHDIIAEHYYAFEKAEQKENPELIYMTWLIVEDDSADVRSLPRPETRELDLLTVHEKNLPFRPGLEEIALRYGLGFNTVPRFTDEVIVIADATNQKQSFKKFLDRIICKKDDKLYFVDEAERNVVEISSGEKFPRSFLFDESSELKAGVIEYNNHAVGSRALPYEGNDIYLVPASNLKTFSPKRWLENIFYRDIDETEYRTSQFFLPSSNFEQAFDELKDIGTFALYMGNLFPYRRGFALISDDFATQAFNEHFSDKAHKITEMSGCVVLCCPYLCKNAAQIVKRDYMNNLIERRGCETIVFRRDEMTETVARDLQDMIRQKGRGGKYSGKLVIVTDKDFDADIDYLTDLTAFDNPADLRRQSGLNVIGMSKNPFGAEEGVTFDKSFIVRLMEIEPSKAHALLEKLFMAYAKKRMDELNPEKSHAPSYKDIKALSKNPRQAALKTLGKRFAQMFPDEYKEMLNELTRELDNMLTSGTFPTLGIECFAITDPAKDFGVDILERSVDCVEAVCVFAEQEKISTLVGSIPHEDRAADLFKIKPVSVKEYIERLNKCLELSDALKSILTEAIQKISSGVIVLPASNAEDFLYGASIKLYFHEEIVQLVWNGK